MNNIPTVQQDSQVIQTSRQLNYIGIVLAWFAVGFLAVVMLAHTVPIKTIGFAGFTVLYLLWLAAERSGGIFDFVVVSHSHYLRLLIAVAAVTAVLAGLTRLAIFNGEDWIIIFIAVAAVAGATAMRFVGVKE